MLKCFIISVLYTGVHITFLVFIILNISLTLLTEGKLRDAQERLIFKAL